MVLEQNLLYGGLNSGESKKIVESLKFGGLLTSGWNLFDLVAELVMS